MAWYRCVAFAVAVDVVTSLWVYLGRNLSFNILANAMFLPAIFSIVFVDNVTDFLCQIVGTQSVFSSVLFSSTAIVVTYLLVYGCLGLGVCLGWTKKTASNKSTVHANNRIPIRGFLRAAGEEMGWRCYLLPCLMSNFSPQTALLISGVAWGFFHVAVMILLTYKLKTEHPVRTVIVQCLSCVLSAYPHGWLAIKARYSLWPSTVMHFWWNRINPQILGSIYTNSPGKYYGKQWKINGEGLAGCLIMIPVAFLVVIDLNNTAM